MQGLIEVKDHFRNYPQIPQRKELSHQVTSLRASMGDFQEAPSGEREQDGKWER